MFYCLIKFLQSLQLLCVSVCNIFIALYLVCKAKSCAAILSHSVSPFISPLESHKNVSSSQISCVSILCFHSFSLRTLLNLLSCVECLPFMCHCSHLIDWLKSSTTFAAVLIVELIFGWFLS